MSFIALVTAVPAESNVILPPKREVKISMTAGKRVYRYSCEDKAVLLMHSGIGKVNAAHAATFLMEHFPLRLLVNFGVGGAYPASGLTTGDIAVATEETYGDEGVTGQRGFQGLEDIGIPLVKWRGKRFFNTFPADQRLVGRALSCAGGTATVKGGTFVTVSSVSGTTRRAREIEKRFHAICENMEGAALAQVCALYRVPFLELRGISNVAGVRDKRRWNIKRAAHNSQDLVLKVLKSLD